MTFFQNSAWDNEFSIGLFVTDSTGKMLQVNQDFKILLDLHKGIDLYEQNVYHLMGLHDFQPEDILNQIRTITFTLPGTEKQFILKIKRVMKDGEIYVIGMLTGLDQITRDEEWCNHFQYQLIRNQQIHILEKRLEGLIHNINTPLNTIIGYVQILLRENFDSKALQKIMESGFQIDASLKSVYDKIEASRSRFKQFIDVNQVIRNELEIGKNNLFLKHNVQVEQALGEDLPAVQMVYGDLSYCIDAVILNAIDSLYDRESKIIYIETKVQNNYLRIIVRDTGFGIPPQDIPFIYEYGFTTRKNNNEHLGLGLSFTKRVIQDYQGKIVINSELQVGTTVTIDLPVED